MGKPAKDKPFCRVKKNKLKNNHHPLIPTSLAAGQPTTKMASYTLMDTRCPPSHYHSPPQLDRGEKI